MSLKGELSDLSLAELIEFFCNQRKTGRLTVSYPDAPAYFYLQSGSVVHASVGGLRGIEAVYYALTQSNASFNFSAAYEAPDQTINQPWTSVVLEGLRRMDEGIKPRNPFSEEIDLEEIESEEFESEEFESAAQPVTASAPEAEVAPPVVSRPLTQSQPETSLPSVEPFPVVQSKPIVSAETEQARTIQSAATLESIAKPEAIVEPKAEVMVEESFKSTPQPKEPVSDTFLSSTQHASKFSNRPWKFAAVFAALVLIVAGIAVPWGWHARGRAKAVEQVQPKNEAAPAQTEVATENSQPTSVNDLSPALSPEEANATSPGSEAADAARREREARAREEARLKAKAAEANASSATTPNSSAQSPSSTTSAQSTAGQKKAVVQVTYDENGRVTQASGSDSTALRIARQRRFPPGKAGSATLTIPIN